MTLGPVLGGGRLSTLDGSLDLTLDLAALLSESVDEISSNSYSIPPPVMTEGGMASSSIASCS